MGESIKRYKVSLAYEEITFPSIKDILILGSKSQHGKQGIYKSINLLVPGGYEMVEVDSTGISAIFVKKSILNKIPASEVIKILEKNIFPSVSENEIVRVSFNVKIVYNNIEGDL